MQDALRELAVEWRTVTLALPAELDRALELVAARRGWTKKETVAWALCGRSEVRRELAQDAKYVQYASAPLGARAKTLKAFKERRNGGKR